MSIEFKQGNMFDEPAEAIVNTVNCVGVMGKGVALEFKKRWPENYKQYRALCKSGEMMTGKIYVFQNENLFGDTERKFLVNFPTKQHWRSKSKIEYVINGLDNLREKIIQYQMKSIIIPPLGCGNGGLDWGVVKPLIIEKLSDLEAVTIKIFEPFNVTTKPEFNSVPNEMTVPRAVMVKALGDLEVLFNGHFTRLTVQKIVYFLQHFGVQFGLKYEKAEFGPYSRQLHDACVALEAGNYIQGYTLDEPKITVASGAYAAADEYLGNKNADFANGVILKASHLIEGFESPFGLELLSSVHFLSKGNEDQSVNRIFQDLGGWNEHKRNSFSEEEVKYALHRLVEDGLA